MTVTASPGTNYTDIWRPARWGTLAVIVFLALLGTWSALAPLSGAVIANGTFQVEGRRQTVQHPYGGVIRSLAVREGDSVAAGDVLITLSDTEPQAEVALLRQELGAVAAQRARLLAERDGTDPVFGPETPDQVAANERALLAARAAEHAVNLDIADRRIRQLAEQEAGLDALVTGLERQGSLLAEEAAGVRQLAENGNAPRTRVLEIEGEITALQSDLSVRQAERLNIAERIGEARLDRERLVQMRLGEITAALAQTDAEIAALGPRLAAAEDRLARTRITAPTGGQVVGLAVFTEGGVVQPGAPLLDIVPDDNPLMVQAQLRPVDISDVTRGASVDVRLIGVPRDARPSLSGIITTVSADTISAPGAGAEGSGAYYALEIALDPAEVAAAGVDLQSGMPVQVVIETEPRTLFAYLTGPLFDELGGAFRER